MDRDVQRAQVPLLFDNRNSIRVREKDKTITNCECHLQNFMILYLVGPKVPGELAKEHNAALGRACHDMKQEDHADRIPDLAGHPSDSL